MIPVAIVAEQSGVNQVEDCSFTSVMRWNLQCLKQFLMGILKFHSKGHCEENGVLWIECFCLIDEWKEISTDTIAWSVFPRGQSCKVQQDSREEVGNRSSKEVFLSELLGKLIGKSTLWLRDWEQMRNSKSGCSEISDIRMKKPMAWWVLKLPNTKIFADKCRDRELFTYNQIF